MNEAYSCCQEYPSDTKSRWSHDLIKVCLTDPVSIQEYHSFPKQFLLNNHLAIAHVLGQIDTKG